MKKLSLGFIAFLQAVGLVLYTSLIGFVMTHSRPGQSLLGSTVILSIFMISAVICAGLYLGYAFWLFWERKQTNSLYLYLAHSLHLLHPSPSLALTAHVIPLLYNFALRVYR